jgi:hypothetical protein
MPLLSLEKNNSTKSLEQIKQSKKSTRAITIESDVDDTSFSYNHWTGKYDASEITVSSNNQSLFGKKKVACIAENETLTIEYSCSFANGLYKSKKTILFQLDPKESTYKLQFSWNNNDRLSLTPIKTALNR